MSDLKNRNEAVAAGRHHAEEGVDLVWACGSTVGLMIATERKCSTVDIGLPMLSMHSIRGKAGTADAAQMIAVLQ